jgi:hypothetical protein
VVTKAEALKTDWPEADRAALDIFHNVPGRAFVPLAIEVLSREPELHEKVARMVFRLQFAPLFSPQADKYGLVVSHNDP